MTQLILMILGFVLLIKGSNVLIDGACSIAKKFHIPEIIIGVTIIAIGTSLPELIISIQATYNNSDTILIGNIVGSNIANLLLILGTCALIKPLKYTTKAKYLEIPICIISTIILIITSNTIISNRVITKEEGIFLIANFLVFILINLVFLIKNKEKQSNEEIRNDNIFVSVALILIGILSVKIGGDFVVTGTSSIARSFGISEKIISMTIVAIGSSLPELATSINAIRKNRNNIAIGTIIGSNIVNILLILGICSVINPIYFSVSYNKDIMLLIMTEILFLSYAFIGEKNTMTRQNGISFLIMYLIYLISIVSINR